MNENLIPFNEQTKEEQREKARKGGIASGEARRKKKAMKDQIELLLSLPLKDKRAREQFEELGIDVDNIDNQMAVIVKMFQLTMQGGKNSVSAATFLRDTGGDKPKETIEVSKSTDETIKEVDDYLCKKKQT